MKILLVEDDKIFADQLSAELINQNYMVEAVSEADHGWDYALSTNYDLIVLDVNLPDLDGISLCQKLREAQYKGAILLLTANNDSEYKVRGLDAGADDYVVKPCTSDELCARIRALLRRPRELTATVLTWGALQLDPSICKVFYSNREIYLSPKEYSLLELFLRNPQRIFSSGVLLERLWSFEETPGEETVRAHIKRLRRKLKQGGADQVIENIYGMGYRLTPPPEAESDPTRHGAEPPAPAKSLSPANEDPAIAPQALTSPQSAARKAALATLPIFRPILLERLAVLDQFLHALVTNTWSVQQQIQAWQAAHKLVGSLGMFGLTDGSRISQNIETSLGMQQGAEAMPPDLPSLRTWMEQLHQVLDPILVLPPAEFESAPPPTTLSSSGQPPSVPGSALKGDLSAPTHRENPLAQPTLKHVLVLSENLHWVEALGAIAQAPLQILSTANLPEISQRLAQKTDLMILDMAAFKALPQCMAFLKQLMALAPQLPIIVRVSPDTFQVRLEIARSGCECTCLPPTMPPQELWRCAIEWYQKHAISQLRILLVDDDPIILEGVKNQLTAVGLQVMTLQDPQQFWDTLHLAQPDLLLLDFEMPAINGIELCRILRADRTWQHLPILFLSGKRDPELAQKIYHAGADDFITKPVTELELLTRIINRIHRRHG